MNGWLAGWFDGYYRRNRRSVGCVIGSNDRPCDRAWADLCVPLLFVGAGRRKRHDDWCGVTQFLSLIRQNHTIHTHTHKHTRQYYCFDLVWLQFSSADIHMDCYYLCAATSTIMVTVFAIIIAVDGCMCWFVFLLFRSFGGVFLLLSSSSTLAHGQHYIIWRLRSVLSTLLLSMAPVRRNKKKLQRIHRNIKLKMCVSVDNVSLVF